MLRSSRSVVIALAVLSVVVASVVALPTSRLFAEMTPAEGAGQAASGGPTHRDRDGTSAPTAARYRGRAFYYGANAPEGMFVQAFFQGRSLVTGTVFLSGTFAHYTFLVPGDDPDTPELEGPQENDLIQFKLGGVTTDESQTFNNGEFLDLDLHVSKMEVCLGAYEDLDRDDVRDPGDPLLAGVDINVLQFLVVRRYTTTGEAADEPSCALHDPIETTVRAADWPTGYAPLGGAFQPVVAITNPVGAHIVEFAFVQQGSSTPSPTNSPVVTTIPTPSFTPSATGPTPTRTPSPTPTATRTGTVPATTATPTRTSGTPATATRTATATNTRPPVTITPSPTTIPSDVSIIVVNSPDDPGNVGDLTITLDEALRLANGTLAPGALSLVESQQLLGSPGSASQDVILFDPVVFPLDEPQVITVQPPPPTPPVAPDSNDAGLDDNLDAVLRRTGLPQMDAGNDTVDASGRGVVLAAGIGGDPFDGLVVASNGNAVRGLHLRDFNAGLVVADGANNVLGGSGDDGNVVVNNIAGVVITGPASNANSVLGNYIGVDRAGKPEGNATYGVLIAGEADNNIVGAVDVPNVIGANFLDGVAVIGGGVTGNVIRANRIGTTLGGVESVPNGTGVVVAGGAENTSIGTPGAGNLISGNISEGVWIQSLGTRNTRVQGNIIGANAGATSPLPNGGSGVLISDGARDSLIGGSEVGEGNRIAFNGDAGVWVRGASALRNAIRSNSITENVGEGIKLTDGSNAGIAPPVLVDVDAMSVAGVAVPGSTVEVFSDVSDEGDVLEGVVTAGPDGRFEFTASQPFVGPDLHATNTDGLGNTSEFGSEGVPPPSVTPRPTSQVNGALLLPILLKNEILFTELNLDPALANVPMGAIHSLALHVRGAVHLYGAQIELAFDPARLEVIDEDPGVPGVQILPGDFPAPGRKFKAENLADNERGTIRYSFTLIGSDELNGNGLMATIRVRAKSPGRAEMVFDKLMLSDPMALTIRSRGRDAVMEVGLPVTNTPVGPTSPPPATNTSPPPATNTSPPPATNTSPPPATNTSPPPATNTSPPPGTTQPPTATNTSPPPGTTQPPTATNTSPPPATTQPPPPTVTAPPSATATQGGPPTATSPVPATNTPPGPPTATQPPPPTVPATATPVGCRDPLRNRSFETDSDWTLASHLPRYTLDRAHTGKRSLLLGILPGEPNVLSWSSAWQRVRVPNDATNLTVAAWTYQQAEAGAGPDRQLLLVYDIDPADNATEHRQPIATVFGERTNTAAWQRRSLTLGVSQYRGRFLWIYSTVMNDGYGGRVWMNLDDTEAMFCP